MLLPEINQKMTLYKDCTGPEILLVGVANFVGMAIVFSLLCKVFFNQGILGLLVALILLFHTTRFWLGKLQKIKLGKPDGYFIHVTFKKISQSAFASLAPTPYVQRLGKWSVRRDDKKVRL